MNEPVGNCGCRLARTEEGLKMMDCPLHGAARDLFEASTMLLDRLDHHGSIDPVREEGPIEDLRQAVAKAKGRG